MFPNFDNVASELDLTRFAGAGLRVACKFPFMKLGILPMANIKKLLSKIRRTRVEYRSRHIVQQRWKCEKEIRTRNTTREDWRSQWKTETSKNQ
ncbi:hypothetical protein ACTXT7_015078 [Hymenolepis weldensis]